MIIWRYDDDGSLDLTFNSGFGYTTHTGSAGGTANAVGSAITLDAAGRILVAGVSGGSGSNDMVVWRFLADGTLDASFGGQGWVVNGNAAGGNAGDHAAGIAVDPLGRIVSAGGSWNGLSMDLVVWRHNDDGSLDPAFNGQGWTVHDSAAGGVGSDTGWALAMDATARPVASGHSWNGVSTEMALWRFRTDGVLDSSFNSVGYATHNGAAGGNGPDIGEAVVVDGQGRIVVAGQSAGMNDLDVTVWRYQ